MAASGIPILFWIIPVVGVVLLAVVATLVLFVVKRQRRQKTRKLFALKSVGNKELSQDLSLQKIVT